MQHLAQKLPRLDLLEGFTEGASAVAHQGKERKEDWKVDIAGHRDDQGQDAPASRREQAAAQAGRARGEENHVGFQ